MLWGLDSEIDLVGIEVYYAGVLCRYKLDTCIHEGLFESKETPSSCHVVCSIFKSRASKVVAGAISGYFVHPF